MTELVLVFKKIDREYKTEYDNFYSSLKTEIIINENCNDVFESIYSTILSNIQTYLAKASGWIIDSVIDHTFSILNYNPLA